jgi:hypothetical protein
VLAVNMEVLFIVGGVQTNFHAEKSSEQIDEIVVLDMPYYKNIVDPISLDQ